jgi:hypothetical protein
MPDVKKLITGFLIVAAAASSSAWILSNLPAPGNTAPVGANTAPTSSPAFGGNAFANNANMSPEDVLGIQPSSTVDAQLNDPNNLTNALSDSFLNNIVETNPSGIQTDASGNPALAQPDNQAVLAQLSQDHAMTGVRVPNWDVEAVEIKLNTIQDSSPAAVAAYSTALTDLFDNYFIKTNLQSMAAAHSSSDSIDPGYVAAQVQAALRAAAAIKTPKPVLSFQKSLIKLLVYEKNTLALAQNSSNDPVKNSLIIQAEQQKYNLAIQEMQAQMQKLSTLGGFSFGKTKKINGAVAFIDGVLGIKTAEALFGVGDITFDPAIFGEWILKFAEDTALQIVKNALISLIQQKVLKWVQGSGAPRFVQNWATSVVNAYQAKAISALNQQFQCVGTTQLPLLKVLLATPQVVNGNNICANQFQSQLGNNLNSLSGRFTNWNDYFSLYQPQGSMWGSLVTIQDNVAAAASQNAAATQSENTASQGFTGSKVCADGSNPMGQSLACFEPDGSMYYPNKDGSCPNPGEVKKPGPNNGLCGNGEYPQIATPGTVTAQGFGVALDTSPKLVTAASTIAGLLASLTSSLLNTLAQAAITYSNQQVNGALSGGGGSGGGGGISDSGVVGVSITTSTIPTQAGPGVQCIPQNQTLSLGSSTTIIASFQAQGGATDVTCALNGNCPASENSDGTPIYSWTASGATNTGTNIGGSFTATYNATGTYQVSVGASTDNTNSSCTVNITP